MCDYEEANAFLDSTTHKTDCFMSLVEYSKWLKK